VSRNTKTAHGTKALSILLLFRVVFIIFIIFIIFIKYIIFDIFMLYLFKIGVYLIEFILLVEHNDDIKIIFFADSMWTPCRLHVESMWSPLESRWSFLDSMWTPGGVHVESTGQPTKKGFFWYSIWSPCGLYMESCGVMESTWILWRSVKYTIHTLYGGREADEQTQTSEAS